jgi:putative transposase
MCFHVLNRAVGRRTLFHTAGDYAAFLDILAETLRTRPMRICGYCVMPNHWHMVLWPEHDGDLSTFLQHLTNLHVKRWKFTHGEIGLGHLYQGRFKSFPIQSEHYFVTAVRYVERNPLRGNLVARAEDWLWSSLGQQSTSEPIRLARWPVPGPTDATRAEWIERVNAPQTDAELKSIWNSVTRGAPFGDERWANDVAQSLGLTSSLHPRGRPRKIGDTGCARSSSD